MTMMVRAEETTAGCCALPEPTRDRTKVDFKTLEILKTLET